MANKGEIIVRPIISEKASGLSGKLNKYSFVVAKAANKIEIGNAFKEMFPGVSFTDVNTSRVPGKIKGRNTKSGYVKGKVRSYKKAVITLPEGETIDIYGSEG